MRENVVEPLQTPSMTQNMINGKVIVTEEDEALSPPPTPSGDIDGESLGSQDSLSEISEDEEYHTPPPPPQKKRRQSSYAKTAEKAAAPRTREIDSVARLHPTRQVAIRNRTRESITRQLHYQRDLTKLTRLKTDATKLLSLWQAL
ncbi:MAG: 33 kDa protein [Psittacine adenovirus 12]